jgi:hypothetical protein
MTSVEKLCANFAYVYRQTVALRNTVLNSTLFFDVTQCSAMKVTDISEEYTGYTFRDENN